MANLFMILDHSVSRLERFSLTALAITELRAGLRVIEHAEVNIKEVINNSVNDNLDLFNPKNLKLQVKNPPEDLLTIGDVSLLLICFESILENAVRYSPSHGTIIINNIIKDDCFWCEIQNQGVGFPDVALDNLFRLFMPGEPHVDKNVGLELPLVKYIMEAHSGKIEAENLENGGAKIRLIFKRSY
jgi:two-component system, sensor histidine kinase and response regulator